MNKKKWLLLLLTPLMAWSADNTTPEAILHKVDESRIPDTSLSVEITITPFNNQKADMPSHYTLLADTRGNSLLEAHDFEQRGQKFLSTDKGLWFYAPGTRRAIRLTPLQMLRGQASIGDISRLSLARDYTASDSVPPPGITPEDRTRWLALTAQNDTATYTRILLAVDSHTLQPKQAMLYVASGRLLKIVQYGPADPAHQGRITTMRYTDAIDRNQQTLVQSGEIKPRTIPETVFNPRSLEE